MSARLLMPGCDREGDGRMTCGYGMTRPWGWSSVVVINDRGIVGAALGDAETAGNIRLVLISAPGITILNRIKAERTA